MAEDSRFHRQHLNTNRTPHVVLRYVIWHGSFLNGGAVLAVETPTPIPSQKTTSPRQIPLTAGLVLKTTGPMKSRPDVI
ncbi:hypothetical protein NDU88_000184 [Pleurodeles waltl]|uniref:Uncharacterized protein n=1 Tax=Pleurodeles waltl TaxID=8319 RepID=A0AAV7V895_PLEWA|nr:hypothetical protein NDU88_000184 [Pleurodeles waltl]